MAKAKTASEKLHLKVEKRDVVGKKVKQLRKKGLLPANVFGPDIKSESISVPLKDFLVVYRQAHETGIIYLELGTQSIPTLIRAMQRHPLTDEPLHIDFRKIDLKQKIENEVPVEIVGESIAVTQHGGVLLNQHDHLTVEALPEDIPQSIQADISAITELGQEIKVSDLKITGNYVIKDEPDTVVVSVIAHKEESVTPETTVATPEVIGEAPAEGEEGAAAEGEASETPKAEGKQEADEKPSEK